MEPFPTRLDSQCGLGRFKPYQCLEQLALIEGVDCQAEKIYRHADLLDRVCNQRQKEACDCQVLTEMLESAVQRLVNYSLDSRNACANARFLDLRGTEAERREQLKGMVHALADVLEKENVDLTTFKPNHFATLSVYHALFLRKGIYRPRNGLNRWCFGLRAYILGSEIESEADKKENLASQCSPMHYDANGDNAKHVHSIWGMHCPGKG